MDNAINIIFALSSDSRTFKQIWTEHENNVKFAEDSSLNLQQGDILATDKSSLKLVVTNATEYMQAHGYDVTSMRELPTGYKNDFTMATLSAANHILAKRYSNKALKGIVLHADEKNVNLHVFFKQHSNKRNDDDLMSPHHRARVTEQKQSTLAEQQAQKQLEHEKRDAMLARKAEAEALRQRRTVAQQQAAVDEEAKKKRQRQQKQQQQRHNRSKLYRQQQWWQKNNNGPSL